MKTVQAKFTGCHKNGWGNASRVQNVFQGHHVYKNVYITEHDENAIGVYKPATKQSDLKKTLTGHVPIELSRLLKNFLDDPP